MGTSRDTNMPDAFPGLVRQTMPGASDETIARIQENYDFSAKSPAKLAWDWVTDSIFHCNAYNIARAYASVSKRYIMSTPPATHGMDVNCKSKVVFLVDFVSVTDYGGL
jgi:hypothetical protein